MKAKNFQIIRKAKIKFGFIFLVTLCIIFVGGFLAIRTAQEGILILEERYDQYTGISEKQAIYNFEISKIISYINKLRIRERSRNEHKVLQGIITEERKKIMFELESDSLRDQEYFVVYEEILKEVQEIQSILDESKQKKETLGRTKEELEKCKEKYFINLK
ncbi:MAG: hypothetical protein AAF600_16965 [Bacteroidota bacterium]